MLQKGLNASPAHEDIPKAVWSALKTIDKQPSVPVCTIVKHIQKHWHTVLNACVETVILTDVRVRWKKFSMKMSLVFIIEAVEPQVYIHYLTIKFIALERIQV